MRFTLFTLACLASVAAAETGTFVLSNASSHGLPGHTGNSRLYITTAPGAVVTRISWELTVVSAGASRASEASVGLTGTDRTRMADVRPFVCDARPGTAVSTGSVDVSIGPLTGPVCFTENAGGMWLRDGVLELELFESFEDSASAEAIWNGTITVEYVPAGFCVSDWNYDGGVDSDDVIAFFADWDISQADYNGDGGTDGDDIIVFFGAWDAGC
jgi:hypothetical protein